AGKSGVGAGVRAALRVAVCGAHARPDGAGGAAVGAGFGGGAARALDAVSAGEARAHGGRDGVKRCRECGGAAGGERVGRFCRPGGLGWFCGTAAVRKVLPGRGANGFLWVVDMIARDMTSPVSLVDPVGRVMRKLRVSLTDACQYR